MGKQARELVNTIKLRNLEEKLRKISYWVHNELSKDLYEIIKNNDVDDEELVNIGIEKQVNQIINKFEQYIS